MTDQVNHDEAPEDAGLAADAPTAGDDALTALQAELAEAKQAALYAAAETQNVRRRLEKDAADARAYGATAFARDILSVADNLARALGAIPEEARQGEAMQGLIAGLEATQREFDVVMQRNGVTPIEAMGQTLDPNRHQAMIELPSDEPPGTIIQELQRGYMIRDRLLRPAMVAVAKSG